MKCQTYFLKKKKKKKKNYFLRSSADILPSMPSVNYIIKGSTGGVFKRLSSELNQNKSDK